MIFACQWSVHLLEHITTLPSHVQPSIPTGTLHYVIQKLHIQSHKLHCQLNYSLNLLPGAGCTDGEGIEQSWASLNPVTNSVKQMGLGPHHDTIDDHLDHGNWQKTVRLGEFLIIYFDGLQLNLWCQPFF